MTSSPAPGLSALEATGVPFELRDRPSKAQSLEEYADFLGVAPAHIIKCLVVRLAAGQYVFVLVPGGRKISWQQMRAALAVNRLTMPGPEEARDVTGYERGTITPFGATHPWPVYVDAAIAEAPDQQFVLGLGTCDVAAALTGADLIAATDAAIVDVTQPA